MNFYHQQIFYISSRKVGAFYVLAAIRLRRGQSYSSTPQLPFKTPQIPADINYKAIYRGTLGFAGSGR